MVNICPNTFLASEWRRRFRYLYGGKNLGRVYLNVGSVQFALKMREKHLVAS